jgi:hypothetical protein
LVSLEVLAVRLNTIGAAALDLGSAIPLTAPDADGFGAYQPRGGQSNPSRGADELA